MDRIYLTIKRTVMINVSQEQSSQLATYYFHWHWHVMQQILLIVTVRLIAAYGLTKAIQIKRTA